jgi:hypothetical protein
MDNLLIPAALVLILTNISFATLAARHWYRAEVAQRELARLATQHHAAGYDTGLVEKPIVQVLDAS